MKMTARNPVIALSYSDKHKAQPKELLIDYETGHIYVVSATDKEVIFDITKNILDKLELLDGGKIEITIEGIGSVNLTEYLNKLTLDMRNTVQAVDVGDTTYIGKENVVDNSTIEVNNRYVSLKGYAEAETYMIPRKGLDGNLEWIQPNSNPGDDNIGNGGGTIPPPNPDDGQIQGVYEIEPIGDKLYLRATRRQRSTNITRNCMVTLPKIIDVFSEIEWYVKTNSFAPLFKFLGGVIWSNPTHTQPKEDGSHVYRFKTWDSGETWLAELISYNESVNVIIDKDYLDNNYYDIVDIHDKYYNKGEVNYIADGIISSIPDIPEIPEIPNLVDYPTRDEILDLYYDKNEVNDIRDNILGQIPDVPEIPEVDLEDYPTRTELQTNYYDKIEVNVIKAEIVNMIPEVPEVPEVDLTEYPTILHLETNYYDKNEVDTIKDNILGQIPIFPEIPDIPNLEDYPTKDEIVENYYDKSQVDANIKVVDDRIDGINGVDPTNYLDKVQIEVKYYDKDTIDTQHYDKSEIEDLFDWEVQQARRSSGWTKQK